MACKDLTREIRGVQVFCVQWPASVALENLSKALALTGPRFTSFVNGEYSFGDVMLMLAEAESTQITGLIKQFCSGARIGGKQLSDATFNQYFSGNLTLAVEVFAFVAEHNYKDFFEQGLKPMQSETSEEESEQEELEQEPEQENLMLT